jgi:hypothetical protein
VAELLKKAREELDLRRVFAETYFDKDGLWKYTVHEADSGTADNLAGRDIALRDAEYEDQHLTLDQVARAHPLVLQWTRHVEALADELHVDLARMKAIDEESG